MTHKNVAHDAYYICTTCGSQCQLAGFSIFAEKIWSNRKKMKRDTIDICTVIFVQWQRQHMLQRRGRRGERPLWDKTEESKSWRKWLVISSSESQSTFIKNFTMGAKKVIGRRVNPNPDSHDFTSWCAFITHLSPGRFMMAHMLEIKFLLQIGRGCHQWGGTPYIGNSKQTLIAFSHKAQDKLTIAGIRLHLRAYFYSPVLQISPRTLMTPSQCC